MIGVAVLYPKTETSHFDTDYYHAKHMKLVRDLWEPMGLRGARVMHGQTGPDGKAPPYAVITVLEFDSLGAFGKAASAHGGAIMGDIPNFTDVQPVMQFNEIMA
ncbi:EthD family reductase [Acidiphilium sp. AL]|uniref:EthD family reductase n=1 Tax=Acidiphilium iwatense TaxID=768198 RepID=A0ABS9DYH6_9PROT|nr:MULTISPECIES: EthD family reductase [Acidiphilium]MCF3947743.1 EthD family reductase [Acidiphilium iwatense]MCU4160098.1 EthD family reductase [Acidiphilium sp. AL]